MEIEKCEECGKRAVIKSAYNELYCADCWQYNDNLKRDVYGKRPNRK